MLRTRNWGEREDKAYLGGEVLEDGREVARDAAGAAADPPPRLGRRRASTVSPPPHRRVGRRGGGDQIQPPHAGHMGARRRIRPPRAVAGVEEMSGCHCVVEWWPTRCCRRSVAGVGGTERNGVEEARGGKLGRIWHQEGGKTATTTGGSRAPVAAEGEEGGGEREVQRTRERREAVASRGGG
jgi:hypothetical protein